MIHRSHSQALLVTSTEVNGSSAIAFNRVEQSQGLLSVNSLRIVYCLPSTTVKINLNLKKKPHAPTTKKKTGVKVCKCSERSTGIISPQSVQNGSLFTH